MIIKFGLVPQTLKENRLISVQNISQLNCILLSKGVTGPCLPWGLCFWGRQLGPCCRLWGAHRETPAVVQVLLCGVPLTPRLLLQENKPEQCLAGKSHNTGEQPSQLSMAARYSASPPGVWQLLSVSKVMAQTQQMPIGFTEQNSPGPTCTWVADLGSSPGSVIYTMTWSSLTWFPTNQMEAVAPLAI